MAGPSAPDPPRLLSDRYHIERRLGQGGMSEVYVARDLRHHRRVALKFLRARSPTPTDLERFRREIDAVARLNHPHVVPLFDSGLAGDQPFYVMPYVEGGSLRAKLDRDGPLPLDEALRITREVASALWHAHRAGLVHRDIKPENILLADGIALVADFGIARVPAPEAGVDLERAETVEALTRAGTAIGTPAYMAPEQALGGPVDARTDLYALACVLFEMLAGRPPFQATVAVDLLRMHVRDEPPRIRDLRPGVPGRVQVALACALAKEPRRRQEDMAEFVEALGRVTTGATPEAVETDPARAHAPHPLPVVRTRFIGRAREQSRCAGLLAGERLVTITGMGGCGKTRLALRVAETTRERFADGVRFVDLAPILDEARVALTAAVALSVPIPAGGDALEALVRGLGERSMLVVFDNCEHVLGAVATTVEALLSGCPGLRVLCTSREALGLAGERALALRPMPVPSDDDVGRTRRSEAARLFEDRARAVRPGFRIDAANAGVVADICRRLDGIPLALELAAARMVVLTPAEIRAHLDDRFRLLVGGPRTAEARHQTLAAAIGWSHALLSPDEQRVFRGLSVFVGGFTLAGATAVVGEAGDTFGTLDRLERLVEKSLLEARPVADGRTRYRMLESVREFARARLQAEGEQACARDRHLDHMLAVVEEADSNMNSAGLGRWITRLDAERENILAAHDWCDTAADGASKGLRLQAAMMHYWRTRVFPELGLQLAEQALARPGAQGPSRARARLLARSSLVCMSLGRFEQCTALARASLAIARQLDDPVLLVRTLNHVGAAASSQSDLDTARAVWTEALRTAEQLGDELAMSAVLNNLGELYRVAREPGPALEALARAEVICRRIGRVEGLVINLASQACVRISNEEPDRARELLREALECSRRHEYDLGVLMAADLVVAMAAAGGDARTAAGLWGSIQARRLERHYHRTPHDEAFLAAWLERARASLGDRMFGAIADRERERGIGELARAAQAWIERAGRHGARSATGAGRGRRGGGRRD